LPNPEREEQNPAYRPAFHHFLVISAVDPRACPCFCGPGACPCFYGPGASLGFQGRRIPDFLAAGIIAPCTPFLNGRKTARPAARAGARKPACRAADTGSRRRQPVGRCRFRALTDGHALLWRGDWMNARQLMQALTRRVDRHIAATSDHSASPAQAFARHRERQGRGVPPCLPACWCRSAPTTNCRYAVPRMFARPAAKPGASRMAAIASSRCVNCWR
jgi:hypothetical protein